MPTTISKTDAQFLAFREALAGHESSGNYGSTGSYGHLGRYQFGEALLVDLGYYSYVGDSTNSPNQQYQDWAGAWTGKDGVYSNDDFLNLQTAQDNAFTDAIQRRWNWIERTGLDQYVGTQVNGTTITEAGLLAAAWLKPRALKDYLQSNGLVDFADPNGDSISSRLNSFGQYSIPFENKPFDSTITENIVFDSVSILEQSVLDFESAEDAAAPPPPRRDPLTLDLDGDGIETIGVSAGAYFDHDGNGFAEQTGWVGADDGLLVWDRNSDGRINDGSELFGDQTRLQDGTLAANGFQALAEWDVNADGKIDASDAVWANIKVWQDADGDGYSSASELKNLADFGITGINLSYTSVSTPDGQGNTQVQAGTFTKADGSTGLAGGFEFNRDTLYTIQEEVLAVTSDIAALPDLRGYGNVYDLQQAMVWDTSGSLKSLVESFVAETDLAARDTLFEQILFKWTGADTVDPESRGLYINARRLHVLEQFFGCDAYDAFCDVYDAQTVLA